MIQLARIFSDGLILQRGTSVPIWGVSDREQTVTVTLNGKPILTAKVPEGEFSLTLPAQPAMEDAVLTIGDARLEHVDFGEVWVAGGQSNMEFLLRYTEGGEEEILAADDAHLRMYTVGQYSYASERERGYKAWNPWDRWLPYSPENAGDFSAVAVYFAKELRKHLGVPVGILSCNWGGTSASAWIKRSCLLDDDRVRDYVDDFDALVARLDLDRYWTIKNLVLPSVSSPQTKQIMAVTMKNTFRPSEWAQMLAAQTANAGDAADNPLVGISMEELMAVGPGDANEPGALYENMLTEIMGYAASGVIWYQGESDDKKADRYGALFTDMIACWRSSWLTRNPDQKKLPFLFVQLAPFGLWAAESGAKYPILRREQEQVSKTVPDAWMTSSADVGNIYDIHPKQKAPVGERLSLLARKYVYGEGSLLADAPEALDAEWRGDSVCVRFAHAEGLAVKEHDFGSYNGFDCEELPQELLPPVLCGVNGLRVLLDGNAMEEAQITVRSGELTICGDSLRDARELQLEFAQTGFYQVNLYNEAGIPAKPFLLKLHR